MAKHQNRKGIKSSKRAMPTVPRNLPGTEITIHRRNTFALSKTATDSGRLLATTLNDYSAAELRSVFQLYKIESVRVTMTLINAPNNNANFPTLHVAPQNFSFIVPPSLSEMLQYDKLTIYQFGPSKVQYSRKFTPALLMDASASAGTGQVIMPGSNPFVSTENVNTNYILGSFWLARYSNADVTHTIEVTLDATIKLKGIR